ncbi:MAG: hypothetical protein ACI8UO_004863 [Verrucomicrobiales bacterium]|jgi:hypothetical protein
MTATAPEENLEAEAAENPVVDEHGFNDEDRENIAGAQRALEAGVELKKWWEEIDASGSYGNRFQEAFVHNRPEDHSFGFFETAELAGGKTKVIGNVQQQLYHRPKAGSPQFVQEQIREFVLRYFMRVSVYRTPQPTPEEVDVPKALKPMSQYPSKDDYKLQGFGYSQRYFKKRGSEEIEKFEEADQKTILDLRDLRDNYDFAMIRNPIVDFQMNVRPLGVRGPDLALPIPWAANWLVMSPDTITIDENPGAGLLGRYGIGYSFMRDPGEPGMFAYGPGQLEPTIQTLVWEVHENGDVIVRMSFVSAAPKAILNISANPLDWGFMAANLLTAGKLSNVLSPMRKAVNTLPLSKFSFDPVYPMVRALNFLTFGAAGKKLGISQDEINKTLTYVHFLQHYNAVLGSRQTWEMFPDWTAEAGLPDWVKTGDSA